MLNKSGSKIDPCWTLEATYSQKLEDDPIFFFACDFEGNYEDIKFQNQFQDIK